MTLIPNWIESDSSNMQGMWTYSPDGCVAEVGTGNCSVMAAECIVSEMKSGTLICTTGSLLSFKYLS